MSKRNLFKEAHKMAKEIKNQYPNINYRFEFSLCLSALYKENKKEGIKMVELKGSEKQVKWANDIRQELINNLESKRNEIISENNSCTLQKWIEIDIDTFDLVIKAFSNISSAKYFIEIRRRCDYNAFYLKDIVSELDCEIEQLLREQINEKYTTGKERKFKKLELKEIIKIEKENKTRNWWVNFEV